MSLKYFTNNKIFILYTNILRYQFEELLLKSNTTTKNKKNF